MNYIVNVRRKMRDGIIKGPAGAPSTIRCNISVMGMVRGLLTVEEGMVALYSLLMLCSFYY